MCMSEKSFISAGQDRCFQARATVSEQSKSVQPWVQRVQYVLLTEALFWSPCQEKSPRLRIQVQSIVEAARADRRSRSGISDSAIFNRLLLHKSHPAQPIQEGKTPALAAAPHLPDLFNQRIGVGHNNGKLGPSLGAGPSTIMC